MVYNFNVPNNYTFDNERFIELCKCVDSLEKSIGEISDALGLTYPANDYQVNASTTVNMNKCIFSGKLHTLVSAAEAIKAAQAVAE